jgi:hypothetical protein
MADLKISQLTSATLPLAGTEVLPIVQSSSTKKVATDDLTVKNVRSNATTGILQVAGPGASTTRVATVPDANFTVARTDAAQSFTGDQTLSTGNLIIGTSGKGIDFSATPGTGTSELFDDYEEGTWTPAFAAWTTAPTLSDARYIKIGSQVTVIMLGQAGVNAGNEAITGLPFANSNAVCPTGALKVFGSSVVSSFCNIDNNATSINSFQAVTLTGNYWSLSITYFVTF